MDILNQMTPFEAGSMIEIPKKFFAIIAELKFIS